MDFICPYTCSYRTSSGYCGSTGGWERCQYRQLHQPNTVVGYVPPLKKTNADCIRSMTDEELDKFLGEVQWDVANYCGGVTQKQEYPVPEQRGAWLDWLKQEAKNA